MIRVKMIRGTMLNEPGIEARVYEPDETVEVSDGTAKFLIYHGKAMVAPAVKADKLAKTKK